MIVVTRSQPDPELTYLKSLLETRHSCRAFLPDALPRALIVDILKAASRTASWCNAQPWHVQVISGAPLEALRDELIECAKLSAPPSSELDWPSEYNGKYQTRRRECGWSLSEAVGVTKGDCTGAARQALENFRLFGAPHLVIVTSEATLGTHGVMDCGAWVANFILAANAAGVGSIPQAALASWPDILRKHLLIGGRQADRQWRFVWL